MIGRRRFIKMMVGLGTLATGWGLSRGESAPSVPTLGQASFDRAQPSPTTRPATAITTSTTLREAVQRTAVAVIPKESWGAAPIVGTFAEHDITRMTVHHTASLLERNEDAPGRMRDHQSFHQTERGWPDIAYHFVVDRRGHVYEGRPVWAVGDTGTAYDPTGHFLVCCEGEFNIQVPTQAQLTSVAGLLAWCSARYGVGLDTAVGHRDLANTSCPGDTIYDQLGGIVAHAEILGRDQPVEMTLLDVAEGIEVVEAIEAGRI